MLNKKKQDQVLQALVLVLRDRQKNWTKVFLNITLQNVFIKSPKKFLLDDNPDEIKKADDGGDSH
jgi:hypothetical protein